VSDDSGETFDPMMRLSAKGIISEAEEEPEDTSLLFAIYMYPVSYSQRHIKYLLTSGIFSLSTA
jgi:hypothetical protein